MSDYNSPPDFIANIRGTQSRVASAQRQTPVRVVDTLPSGVGENGTLVKVRAGSMYVAVDGAWEVV